MYSTNGFMSLQLSIQTAVKHTTWLAPYNITYIQVNLLNRTVKAGENGHKITSKNDSYAIFGLYFDIKYFSGINYGIALRHQYKPCFFQ